MYLLHQGKAVLRQCEAWSVYALALRSSVLQRPLPACWGRSFTCTHNQHIMCQCVYLYVCLLVYGMHACMYACM